MGARGDYVRQIQSCLNSVNNAGLATDGIFGPLTQAAVMNFQRANGLQVDGIVGPITWENLMRRCSGAGAMPIRSMPAPLAAPVVNAAPVVSAAPVAAVAPAAQAAQIPEPAAEIVSEPDDEEEDTSYLGIEYSPNFAAKDNSSNEYIEESLGKVEPVLDNESAVTIQKSCGCGAVKPMPTADSKLTVLETTLSQFSMNEILIYLLGCETRNK
jgi:hypothetical protein